MPGTGGGTRTLTAVSGLGILSPLRLPFRHSGIAKLTLDGGPEGGTGVEATVGVEPTNEAFAEPSLNHLGTSPSRSEAEC